MAEYIKDILNSINERTKQNDETQIKDILGHLADFIEIYSILKELSVNVYFCLFVCEGGTLNRLNLSNARHSVTMSRNVETKLNSNIEFLVLLCI